MWGYAVVGGNAGWVRGIPLTAAPTLTQAPYLPPPPPALPSHHCTCPHTGPLHSLLSPLTAAPALTQVLVAVDGGRDDGDCLDNTGLITLHAVRRVIGQWRRVRGPYVVSNVIAGHHGLAALQ